MFLLLNIYINVDRAQMSITIAKQNAVNAKCKLCVGSTSYWCKTISVTAIWEQYSASTCCPQVNISSSGEWICVFWYIRSPQKANTVYFHHTDILSGNKQQWQPQVWGSKHLTLIFLCIEEQHKVECCLDCGFAVITVLTKVRPEWIWWQTRIKLQQRQSRLTLMTEELRLPPIWMLDSSARKCHIITLYGLYNGFPRTAFAFLGWEPAICLFFNFFYSGWKNLTFSCSKMLKYLFSSSVKRRKRTCGLFNFRLTDCYISFFFLLLSWHRLLQMCISCIDVLIFCLIYQYRNVKNHKSELSKYWKGVRGLLRYHGHCCE